MLQLGRTDRHRCWKVVEAARLIGGVSDPSAALRELFQDRQRALALYVSNTDEEVRKVIADELVGTADMLRNEGARGQWLEIAESVRRGSRE